MINNINRPLAIASYKGLPNKFRIYTYATINDKNICLGVDVSLSDNTIALSNVISAYGRDINLLLGKESINLLYPNSIEELKQMILQVSTAHNSLLNAPSSASADKDTTSDTKNQISEQESFSLNRDEIAIATPEMVAEANEELSKEPTLVEQLDEAQTALDRLRSKIDKRNQRKDMTFEHTRKLCPPNWVSKTIPMKNKSSHFLLGYRKRYLSICKVGNFFYLCLSNINDYDRRRVFQKGESYSMAV